MQEIIPAIEKVWSKAAEKVGYKVVMFTAEDQSISSEIKRELLNIDAVFITAFNVFVAQKLVLLRKHMFIDAPWIFQLHNQATVGLWPLFHWGMGELLNTQDRFISTCSRDAQCFEALFENSKADIIPFPALHMSCIDQKRGPRFCYVGRISEQKNLHTLIWAYSIYRQHGGQYQLELIGGEDNLSSPNMGMNTQSYLQVLKDLCQKLGVETEVHFKGHIKRDEVHQYWSENECVIVNASLHSDENFGLALMQGLTYGHYALVTDWGGHTDFAQKFNNQVTLLKVYNSKTGPFLDINEFAKSLFQLEKKQRHNRKNIPYYYRFNSVVGQAQKILSETLQSKGYDLESLKKTPLLEEILGRILKYKSYKTGQIFESYEDLLAHKFFNLYGMQNEKEKTENIGIAPWCQKEKEQVIAKDPHRGKRALTQEEAKESGYIQ